MSGSVGGSGNRSGSKDRHRAPSLPNEDVRADRAGAELRAVAQTPSASTARQLAYRFKPTHIRAVERAAARCGNDLDRRLGRDPGEDVTFDLDATESEVYGRKKRGTGRTRQGHLAYNSYVVTWAQRGRGLTSELKGGNQGANTKRKEEDRCGRSTELMRCCIGDGGAGPSD